MGLLFSPVSTVHAGARSAHRLLRQTRRTKEQVARAILPLLGGCTSLDDGRLMLYRLTRTCRGNTIVSNQHSQSRMRTWRKVGKGGGGRYNASHSDSQVVVRHIATTCGHYLYFARCNIVPEPNTPFQGNVGGDAGYRVLRVSLTA